MRADALVPAVTRAARVTDDLGVDERCLGERLVEVVLGQAQARGEGAEQPVGDGREPVLPVQHRRTQLRQGAGPLVRSFQPPPHRLVGPTRAGRPLGAEVQLVAPVRLAVGELVTHPRVAAEVRGLQVADCHPVPLGQREEAAGHVQNVGGVLDRDAGSGQVEEADPMSCGAQIVEEPRALDGVIEGAQIEHGQR